MVKGRPIRVSRSRKALLLNETKVGQRSVDEIEQVIKNHHLDLAFGSEDDKLLIEITWSAGQSGILVIVCGGSCCWECDSLQLQQDGYPRLDRACFDIVERTREEDEI